MERGCMYHGACAKPELMHGPVNRATGCAKKNQSSLPADLPDSATREPENTQAIAQKSLQIGVKDLKDLDLRSLRELAIYGMKGAAGYPGIPHIADGAPGQPKDFSRLIAQAKSRPAFLQSDAGRRFMNKYDIGCTPLQV